MKATTNPLVNIVKVAPLDRPIWLCKHSEAKVYNLEMKRFICFICNPLNGKMRSVSNQFIMENVRKNSLDTVLL